MTQSKAGVFLNEPKLLTGEGVRRHCNQSARRIMLRICLHCKGDVFVPTQAPLVCDTVRLDMVVSTRNRTFNCACAFSNPIQFPSIAFPSSSAPGLRNLPWKIKLSLRMFVNLCQLSGIPGKKTGGIEFSVHKSLFWAFGFLLWFL